jgi:hypothetical protein
MARKRVLRGCLIAAALLLVLSPVLFLAAYRVAAKKLLTGPTLRAEINQKPEEIKIDWDEAVSTWPGRVLVKNLTIRGSDPNVQWIVILPEASVRYSLLPLLRKNFIVTQLRPKSIQFRIRQKLLPGKVSQAHVKTLPPIPGFSDPPMRVEGQKLPEPESDPFTVEVKDVATDVFDDIWVDGFRYQGPAKLRGRFRLKPGYHAQIGPASVDFGGGALAVGQGAPPTANKAAVTPLTGRLEAMFDKWDVQELTENKVFRVVTAKVDLSGPTEGVDFLDGLLRLGPKVHVSGGPGQFTLKGEIDRGKAAGAAGITAKRGKYVRPGLSLVGSADARLKFSNWVLDGGSPEIGGTSLKLTDVFVDGADPKTTKPWWGEFQVPSGRLSDGLTAKVAIKCQDGRPLLAFLGAGLPKWVQGLIDLEGLTASADVIFSEPRTMVRELSAEGGKFKIEGEYDRRGNRSRGAFLIDNGGLLVIGVELDGPRTVIRPLLAKQWFEKARPLIHEEVAAAASSKSDDESDEKSGKPAKKKKS